MDLPGFTAVDLFCGCGGLTLGLWEACRLTGRQLDIRLAVDNNVAALQVFRSNFGCDNKVARTADVVTLFDGNLGKPCTSKELYWKEKTGAVDVLVAARGIPISITAHGETILEMPSI